LPKSMLPPEVEKTLKKLGPDGEKVRGTLEREFASYLEEKAPERRERDLGAVAAGLLGGALRPVALRFGKQLAEQALNPDGPSFADGLRKARERMERERMERNAPTNGSTPASGEPWQPRAAAKPSVAERHPGILATGRVAKRQTRRP
ncbi:MAG: hypothetical protein ABUL57_02235, partial [Chloroflexota bacterium]